MKRWMLVLVLLLSYGAAARAQEISEVYVTSDTLRVYFRQDKTVLDPQFRDNGARLREFSRRFGELLSNPQSKVRSILIVSGASPEGSSTRNRYLSDNRAKVVYDYLTQNRLADPSRVEIESRGEDWRGLAARVRASDLPYKDDVLEILDLPEWITEGGKVVDSRKQRLMNLQGGKVWRELYDLYFADLRGTRVMIAYNVLKQTPRPVKTDTVTVYVDRPDTVYINTVNVDTVYIRETVNVSVSVPDITPQPQLQTKRERPFYLAVKTNLLYDAAVIPNIDAEIGIGRGFTVGGSYQNIWLRNGAYTKWYRVEGFEAGVNWYINKDKRPFRGHHIGLYGQMLTWDITIDGRGYLAERWTVGGGISYGYALAIGRRFNLDFEIGIGYLGGNMHEYIPQDGHRVWQSLEPFRWIGPTKVGVTLQWLIGRGNSNERRAER